MTLLESKGSFEIQMEWNDVINQQSLSTFLHLKLVYILENRILQQFSVCFQFYMFFYLYLFI